jgi:hypothetical protein
MDICIYFSTFLHFAEENKMIYDRARKLPLNCKHSNVSDDALLLLQQTNATPSQPVEVMDAKLIRRQKSKEAKSVVQTEAVVTTAKNTKRSAAESKTSAPPAVPNSKKSKTVIHDVPDSRDEELAVLKLHVQTLQDSILKLTNQNSLPGPQHTSSNNVFVPPSNTNPFQQMFANQTMHQQPQQPHQPQRQHYGASGNCLPYNDDDALCSFCLDNRRVAWLNCNWTIFF